MKLLQSVLLVLSVGCFFFPMFDVDGKLVTGIESIYVGDVNFFGHFIVGIILVVTVVHFVFMIYSLFTKNQKYDSLMNGLVSISLVFGLLLITYMGLITTIYAWLLVGLMVATTWLRYKYIAK